MLGKFLDRWPLCALLACAVLLAIAHAFQSFGHLAPCTLCLKQRDAYWWAMGVSGVGVVLAFTALRVRVRPVICALLALIFLYGAGIAVYHAGAEWKWWPGPAACSGGAVHVTAASLATALKGGPMSLPACDKAPNTTSVIRCDVSTLPAAIAAGA